MLNRTSYTGHDKIRDRLWLHDTRRRELIDAGNEPMAASRIAFHEVREGEIRVAWRIPGTNKRYLNRRRAAKVANERGVKIERVVRYVAAEKYNKDERLLKRRARKAAKTEK